MKVLDFGLQIATGPRQIEETRFIFIHVIVIPFSADIWHEVMLFLLVVLQLWNVPTLKKKNLKNFFHKLKKTIKNSKFRFGIIRMLTLCSTLVQRDTSNMSCTKNNI